MGHTCLHTQLDLEEDILVTHCHTASISEQLVKEVDTDEIVLSQSLQTEKQYFVYKYI